MPGVHSKETKAATGLWGLYLWSLANRPVLTKSLTSSLLLGAEEVVCDVLTGKVAISELAITKAAYGMFVSGPLGHFMYSFVSSLLEGKPLLQLLAINVGVIPVQLLVYTVVVSLMSGESLDTIKVRLNKTFFKTLKLLWMIFPAIQIAVLKFVPQPLWTPTLNLVGFVLGILANLKRRSDMKKAAEEAADADEAAEETKED